MEVFLHSGVYNNSLSPRPPAAVFYSSVLFLLWYEHSGAEERSLRYTEVKKSVFGDQSSFLSPLVIIMTLTSPVTAPNLTGHHDSILISDLFLFPGTV